MNLARRVPRPLVTLTLASSLMMLAGRPNRAEAYDPITWSTVDNGGAVGSTGGGYRLSGTIGQHDAGTLAGGGFVLRGGFWRGGSSPTTGIEPRSQAPLEFRFRTPAPNPVHSRARLSFDLPSPARARLRVFDLSGRLVRTTDWGPLPAGRHDRVWDARDAEGRPLPGGVYFMSLEAGQDVARRRVLVLR
jgi:hypothetical protein